MGDERVCRVSPNFPMILGMRLAWGLPLAPSVSTRLPVLVMRLFPLYTGILEPLVRNGSKACRKYPAMCACDSGSASCSFVAHGPPRASCREASLAGNSNRSEHCGAGGIDLDWNLAPTIFTTSSRRFRLPFPLSSVTISVPL